MSAFGKRGGIGSSGGGGRPSFGVAKPMKGGAGGSQVPDGLIGGDQFPPLEELTPALEIPASDGPHAPPLGAPHPRP